MLSVYSSASPYKVYAVEEWWSDAWDAIDYGREIVWNSSMFDQMQALRIEVPHLNLINDSVSVNSMYCNQTAHMKNCYLSFNSDNLESCHYSRVGKYSAYCLDSVRFLNCEQCYDVIDCTGCYGVRSAMDCENCKESTFLLQCKNCTDCFGCVNLVNKQYCFFNEQLTKDAYMAKIATIDL